MNVERTRPTLAEGSSETRRNSGGRRVTATASFTRNEDQSPRHFKQKEHSEEEPTEGPAKEKEAAQRLLNITA